MRPLFLADARPINVEWNRRPYFGVFAVKKLHIFSLKFQNTNKLNEIKFEIYETKKS